MVVREISQHTYVVEIVAANVDIEEQHVEP
jgi:hypothetical protein